MPDRQGREAARRSSPRTRLRPGEDRTVGTLSELAGRSPRRPFNPLTPLSLSAISPRLASPQSSLLEEKQYNGSHIYGLRDEAAVHSSHGPVEDDRRHKTYIVATYTGELDDHDKHERWYVRRPPRPDMDLDDDERWVHKQLGFYTKTDPSTDASVFVELIGSDGRTSGAKSLSHGPSLKKQAQEFLDRCLGQVGQLESDDGSMQPGHGLRFEERSAVLTREDKERLDAVAHALNGDYHMVEKIVVEGIEEPAEDPDNPILDRHPMYNSGPTGSKRLTLERVKAVREYLRERGVDPHPVQELLEDTHTSMTEDTVQYAGRSFGSRLPVRINKTLVEEYISVEDWEAMTAAQREDKRTVKDYEAVPPEQRPPDVRLVVEEIEEDYKEEHDIFRSGKVDEFAITAPDLGDLKECKVWHLNDGVDMQSSRWKLDKIVVTCLQNSKTASNAGYTTLQPHGKGDHAIRSVKTSDSDQWHFLAYGHWLSCDKGIDLLKINDEIRRASRRIQMVKEESKARERELEDEIKRLQQQKDELKPRGRPDACKGSKMLIPLEDARPEPPQKGPTQWFEDEIYIDYEWNPGSEVLKRAGLTAAEAPCFSSLLTMTRNPESPLQLALNGALDDETGKMDPDGGRVPSNLKDSDGQLVVEKAVRFFREGSPEGVDEEGKKTGRPADNSSAVRYNRWTGTTACFADRTYLPHLDSWELARAYRPKDLENNFNGDKRVKGERIEHAIWKLQRVSKDPKEAEYSLVYIVKSGRGGDKHGVSLQDASVPPPAGGQETDRLAASDRLLGLSEQEEEWVVWAPHMVTHRNDEFIFEVRGKHNLQAADDDWNAVYEGRTLTFGTGQRTRSYYDRCTNLTCKKKYGSAERTTAPGDDDYSQGVGERGEAGDLLLTNAKWRKASDESRVNAGDDGQNGEDDDDEEKGLRRNSTTPQLRGHQVWRLSIPAEVDQDAERPYYETVDDFANWLTDWKKFLLIKVFFIGLAVLGSFMGPALSEQDAMAGVWALVGEAIGLLVGAIVVSLVWCVMSWCGCKGQREDE